MKLDYHTFRDRLYSILVQHDEKIGMFSMKMAEIAFKVDVELTKSNLLWDEVTDLDLVTILKELGYLKGDSEDVDSTSTS